MKLVIITGGSRGLGEALVEQYAKSEEWHIVELSRTGSSKFNIHCDLSIPGAVGLLSHSLFSSLATKSWQEVVYINNAGNLKPISSAGDLKLSDIYKNITINQVSSFTLISAFIASFRDFSGPKSIINLSSGAALKGYAGWSLYCASKAACENFINALAIEEETKKYPFVTVNYDPNVMDTDMQATIRRADESHFPAKPRFIDYKQSGKLRTPDSVASDLIQKIKTGMVNHTRYAVH